MVELEAASSLGGRQLWILTCGVPVPGGQWKGKRESRAGVSWKVTVRFER